MKGLMTDECELVSCQETEEVWAGQMDSDELKIAWDTRLKRQ